MEKGDIVAVSGAFKPRRLGLVVDIHFYVDQVSEPHFVVDVLYDGDLDRNFPLEWLDVVIPRRTSGGDQ
jgi:hypothetical protein